MKNVSTAFKNELNNDNRRYVRTARITLADKTEVMLSNSDFWQNGLKISSASSGSNSFDIGAVVIGQLTLNINNIDERFSDYDFTDAVIDNVKIGLELPDGTVEYLTYGIFTVDSTNYNGSIISLTAYNNIYKFDKPYSESTLVYPATLSEIVKDACDHCGVSLQSVEFANDDFVVNERPADDAITFRNILQWAAQISCHFCDADEQGRLVLKWYDVKMLDGLKHLDGGFFEPWEKDNVVSGGFFNPWTKGAIIDGGSFSDFQEYHHIYSWTRLNVATDDVVITGVNVTDEVETEEGRQTISTLVGTSGYVLEISGNKLIRGKTTEVAGIIGSKIIGMRFRPFSGTSLSNPLIEPGDVAIISDRKESSYPTIITSNDFQPGAFQIISCNAKSAARNSAQRYSQSTQAYIEARKQINKEKTTREKAISDLTTRLENSPGLYTTTEVLPDKSSIFYMHDKPKLADSSIIWKMTAEAWGVSTDGGKSWNAGMTVDGDTIVRILSAVGINAGWINAGTLLADYIKGGTLTLGKSGNQNGVLRILDSQNQEIGRWDANGITATKGSFTGAVTATSGSFTGTVNATSGSFAGTVNATSGSFTGTVTANEGKIGEWYIYAGNLTNGLPYTGACDTLATGMGSYGGGWAFWAGNGRFAVSQAGALHAEAADIAGQVSATSGVFDNVTVRNSNVTNSSLSGSAGSISGGTYSSPYISGGSMASTGGTYVGTCSGSTISSCTLGGTSLATGNGGGYFSAGATGSARMYGPSTAQVSSGGTTYIDGASIVLQRGNVTVYTDFDVRGSKNRAIKTEHYGWRKLAAFETALPTFADYGKGKIGTDGLCYITVDPVFYETIDNECEPTVFLTKYGEGDLYVDPELTTKDTIVIRGTQGLVFAWEVRYKQANIPGERLIEDGVGERTESAYDYAGEAAVDYEHTTIDYAVQGSEYAAYLEGTSIDYAEQAYWEYQESQGLSLTYATQGAEYYQTFEGSLIT